MNVRIPPRLASLCIVLALSSSPVRASWAETWGADPRMQGRAGAGVAADSDTSAAFTNPAALMRVRAPSLHVGYGLSLASVSVKTVQEPSDPLYAPVLPGPVGGAAIGLAIPVSLFVEDRVTIGVHAFLPTAALVHARAPDPAVPFLYVYDASTDHYEIFASVGVRIVDGLALGVGARAGAAQGGTSTLDIDPVRGRFTRAEIDTAQGAVMSPIVGALVGPFDLGAVGVRAAFVLRDKSSFDVTLPAALSIDGLDTSLNLNLVTFSNFSPRTWTGGLTLDVTQRTQASVDVVYAQWSQAPTPFLQVTNDVSGTALDGLGLGGSLDAPASGQQRALPPGLVDTTMVRVGLDSTLPGDRVTLRGGYGYRPSPVPDQTSGTNLVDNSEHIACVGSSVEFTLPGVARRPFFVDVAYQARIFAPRTATKDSPRDPVGSWTSTGAMHLLSADVRYVW